MKMSRIVLALALMQGSLDSCVRSGVVPPPNGGHDVITAEELQHVNEFTLYDAVQRLRPSFLRSRTSLTYGRPQTNPLMLYVDGERMESLDYLRRISPSEVLEVRFYEPQLANTRFARYNNSGGAIAVLLKVGS